MGEWISRMGSGHTVEYYAALNRKGVLTQAATQVNLEDVMARELSQPQKGKYCVIPFR